MFIQKDTLEEGKIESQSLSLLNTDTVVLVRSRPLDRKTKSMKIFFNLWEGKTLHLVFIFFIAGENKEQSQFILHFYGDKY